MSEQNDQPESDPFAIPPPRPKSEAPATIIGEVPAAARPPMPSEPVSPATIVGTVPPMFAQSAPPPIATPYAQAGQPGAAGPGVGAGGTIPYNMPGYAPYPPPTQGPGTGQGQWQNVVLFVRFHVSRAVSRDLRTVDVAPGEEPRLESQGIRDHTIRQYLFWRRSWLYLLLPLAALAAVIQLTGFIAEERDLSTMSWFGVFVLFGAKLLETIGYPIAAGLAVWRWDRLRFSRWVLVVGWFVSYLLPFLVALIPFGNFIIIEETDPDFIRGQKFGAGIAGAAVWLLTLLPAILAIMPGILRASVRIKSLLPESIVPGWIIVMTAPFFTLVLLVVFVMVNQVAGNLLLIFGTLLIMASPAVFLIRTDLLIKPVTDFNERQRLESLQLVYILVVAVGMALLMVYLFTLDILGRPVVGNVNDPANPAMIGVGRFSWEIFSFVLAYLAKSVFITAVAIDLFMLLNLSVWKNLKAFEGTPHAAEYDRIMGSFQTLVEGGDHPFADPPGQAFEIVPPGGGRRTKNEYRQ